MEIIVRKVDLVRELQLVQGVVERKSSIPVLGNVLVEARDAELRIAATDLDVSLRCACAAQVVKEGAITLAAKKLYEIARSLPDSDVHVKVLPETQALIECERVTFKVSGLPREDFPELPLAGPIQGIALDGGVLKDLINRTAFAVTQEEARYYLAGALVVIEKDAVAMVATDGHRLAYARRATETGVSEPQRVLVPRKAIQELARLMEEGGSVVFQQADNHLIFGCGTRWLASKTVEGQFPAFDKVIAITGDKRVTLQREALAAGVRRVSLLSSERSRGLRLTLSTGKLELAASSPELGEARESLVVDYRGEAIEIGFNAQYLLDFLQAAASSQISLELKDAESQGLLRPLGEGEPDYRYVVMPMRL